MLSKTSTLAAEFKEKVAARTARIDIIGTAYVGLPLALLFSEQRFVVTGFDIELRLSDDRGGVAARCGYAPHAANIAML
jgi:hypothetical protein